MPADSPLYRRGLIPSGSGEKLSTAERAPTGLKPRPHGFEAAPPRV